MGENEPELTSVREESFTATEASVLDFKETFSDIWTSAVPLRGPGYPHTSQPERNCFVRGSFHNTKSFNGLDVQRIEVVLSGFGDDHTEIGILDVRNIGKEAR